MICSDSEPRGSQLGTAGNRNFGDEAQNAHMDKLGLSKGLGGGIRREIRPSEFSTLKTHSIEASEVTWWVKAAKHDDLSSKRGTHMVREATTTFFSDHHTHTE